MTDPTSTCPALGAVQPADDTADLEALTRKQRHFVELYLELVGQHSVSEIAIMAGYAQSTALDIRRWLSATRSKSTNKPVWDAVNVRLQTAVQAQTAVTAERLVEEYAQLAFSNMENYSTYNPLTRMYELDFSRVTRGQMAAVSTLTQTERYTDTGEKLVTTKLQLHPKQQSLDSLAKYLRLFSDPGALHLHFHQASERADAAVTAVVGRLAEIARARGAVIEGEAAEVPSNGAGNGAGD